MGVIKQDSNWNLRCWKSINSCIQIGGKQMSQNFVNSTFNSLSFGKTLVEYTQISGWGTSCTGSWTHKEVIYFCMINIILMFHIFRGMSIFLFLKRQSDQNYTCDKFNIGMNTLSRIYGQWYIYLSLLTKNELSGILSYTKKRNIVVI